jgi:hypothetical protein
MEPNIFIFNCVFTDDQFQKLNLIKNECADSVIALNNIDFYKFKFPQLKILQLLRSLREIIDYRNTKGYSYQSYILQSLILEINYIINVLSRYSDEQSIDIHNKLQPIFFDLLDILETCRSCSAEF